VKPIRLKLQNFGPYSGEPVVVDFQRLDPVFLICGDTGAGKTTLFDGICYALYGEPLGTRSMKTLRSNVAREGESTLAEFEFEVRGTRYLARRSPQWFTPRQRGGGFKEDEINTLESRGPNGKVLATRTKDMKEQVEAILGLTHDEFAKILVLPQGEFQKFLEMSTADREGILQKLFPIQDHKRLTDFAKAKAEESRRALQGIQAQLKEAAGDIALDPAQSEARLLELTELVREAAQAEKAALQLRDEAREALQRGQREDRAFKEQDELLRAEAAFQAAQAERDALDQELQLARRAAACEDKVTRLADTRKTLEQAQAELEKTRGKLQEAQGGRAGLQASLDALPGRQRHLEELRNQDARSGKQLSDLTEIGKAWRAGEKAARELLEAETALGACEATASAVKTRLAALALVEQERGSLQTRLDALAPDKERMDRLRSEAETVRSWPARDQALGAEAAAKAALAEAAAGRLRAEEARIEGLRRRRETNLAAALAASLEEGAPCPVCGSSHHPLPAKPAGDDPGSWIQEPPRIGEGFITAAQHAKEEQSRSAHTHALAREACAAALGLMRQAGWSGVEAFDLSRKELEQREAALRTELQKRIDQLASRGELVLAAQTAETALDAARAARDLAQDASTKARAQRETLQTSLGLIVEDPEQAYRDARKAHDGRQAEISRIDLEIQALVAQREASDQAIMTSQETLKALAVLAGNALQTHRDAEADLLGALERQGFGTAADHARARREPRRVEEIERRKQQDAEAQSRRHALLEDFARKLEGKLRPDLESLQAQVRATDAGFTLAADAGRQSAANLETFQHRLQRVQQLMAELERLTLENGNLHRLADELEGNNARRLKFSSWALAWWLERVLAQSTHRLETLSGGRYRFRLRSEINDGRRAAGLEIDVYDAYANAARSVRSLSGGEKFLASLALALGLAEIIQSRGGGIELDALFIDEGFGSLDGETLEQAMRILNELGQGRMVGLISHVDGMKQDITCQVRVLKNEGGSRIETVRVLRQPA